MNIHKMKYQVIKKDEFLSDHEKLTAFNDLLLNLKVQAEVVRNQHFDASTRTPSLLTAFGFTTLSATVISVLSMITAGNLGPNSEAFAPLMNTGIASALSLALLRILAEFKESILDIPLPFTKEANLKRELKKIENVISKIQSEINLLNKAEQLDQPKEAEL